MKSAPKKYTYLMESDDESIRLEKKTNVPAVTEQAQWAGLKPGMRIADIGCGPGKITAVLQQLAAPGGHAVGVDGSAKRLEYARKHYGSRDVEFFCRNILEPLDDLGSFDFIWIRFVLEYYKENSIQLLENVNRILKPGGILFLSDLDHNPLNHYGYSGKLQRTLESLTRIFERECNFDPFAGRTLSSYLYDLGFDDIQVDVSIKSLVYGQIAEIEYFNWMRKIEKIPKVIQYEFEEYKGGYDEFAREFESFINDPRRFYYIPLVCCRGRKPFRNR